MICKSWLALGKSDRPVHRTDESQVENDKARASGLLLKCSAVYENLEHFSSPISNMILPEIYEKFSSKMALIELYRRGVADMADKELKALGAQAKFVDEKRLKQDGNSYAWDKVLFRHPRTGELTTLKVTQRTIAESMESVVRHKNKQYQWLLAEAYEEFEDLLEYVYAFCGKNNDNFWPLEDYGNILFNDIHTKDFSWYLGRAREKKGRPGSILKQIRKMCPTLTPLELTNSLNQNYQFLIILIEKMRHAIVHTAGVVKNRESFTQVVFDAVGLSKNGKAAAEYRSYIDLLVQENQDSYIIDLVEFPTSETGKINGTSSGFDFLFNILIGYGCLICESIISSRPDLLDDD